MDNETSDNLRDEIENMRSNLFEFGLILMLFTTIIYLVILQLYLLALPTMPGLPKLLIGLALVVSPLFLYGGFFIVNTLRR
ncbi:MAG: hypothetical protein ACFFBJ_06380 [Promethearchaeota archaeon]